MPYKAFFTSRTLIVKWRVKPKSGFFLDSSSLALYCSYAEFDKVLEQLPSLKNLLDTYGSMSLFEYAQQQYHIVPNISHLGVSRKRELLDFLDGYVTKKFGQQSTDTVIDALTRNYAVSTAEHHGPIGHPFFSNQRSGGLLLSQNYQW